MRNRPLVVVVTKLRGISVLVPETGVLLPTQKMTNSAATKTTVVVVTASR
jgi:hypothetical protein